MFAALERADDPAAAADDLIARADLGRFAGQSAEKLSTGTLQRLNLAIALAGEPSVLLLDEPTATLSPDQRHRLWRWLDELRGGGMALMFSTQWVNEAMRHGGRIVVSPPAGSCSPAARPTWCASTASATGATPRPPSSRSSGSWSLRGEGRRAPAPEGRAAAAPHARAPARARRLPAAGGAARRAGAAVRRAPPRRRPGGAGHLRPLGAGRRPPPVDRRLRRAPLRRRQRARAGPRGGADGPRRRPRRRGPHDPGGFHLGPPVGRAAPRPPADREPPVPDRVRRHRAPAGGRGLPPEPEPGHRVRAAGAPARQPGGRRGGDRDLREERGRPRPAPQPRAGALGAGAAARGGPGCGGAPPGPPPRLHRRDREQPRPRPARGQRHPLADRDRGERGRRGARAAVGFRLRRGPARQPGARGRSAGGRRDGLRTRGPRARAPAPRV